MIGQLLTAGFYLGIAGFASWVNWHRITRLSGAALLFYSAISTLTFFMAKHDLIAQELLVLREISLATMLSVISWTLLQEGDPKGPHQIVMLCCTVIIAFCGAISFYGDISHLIRTLFPYVVNGGFILNCIAISAPGAADHVRRWISVIDDLRRRDSATPDFDYLIRKIDGK